MNGWLLVRIAGIVVGIATLLRVATNEGIVTYDPLFLAWMDRLSDIVELGLLTDVIKIGLDHGIVWVRSLGYSVPDLQDEWRPAFVFSMLMFGAVGRHSRSKLLFAAAPVGALVIAVWSGLIGALAPVAFAAVFAAVAFGVAFAAASAATPAAGVYGFAAVAFAVAVAAAFGGGRGGSAAAAAVAVAGTAVVYVFAGIVENWGGGWRSVLANAKFNTGIDILFTMSLAFVIAVAAANPPIW
jgi:hypothetical protein